MALNLQATATDPLVNKLAAFPIITQLYIAVLAWQIQADDQRQGFYYNFV